MHNRCQSLWGRSAPMLKLDGDVCCLQLWGQARPLASRAPTVLTLCMCALQGYQSCTQACGLLCLVEPRDAFLTSLCTFTLSVPDNSSPQERSGSLSPPPKGSSRWLCCVCCV